MEAFNILFNQYSNQAIRTVYLIIGRNDMAEDIVQEAFIKCYKEIKSLKNAEAFQSWFYRLLTRIVWRYCSKEKNYLHTESMDDNNRETIADSLVLSDMAEKDEIKKLVNEAVDKLSVPLKTTIILYYYNELSIKEISKILGCFQGTVKSRLHNAKKLLAKELRSEKFEGYSFYNSLNGKEQDENVKPTTI